MKVSQIKSVVVIILAGVAAYFLFHQLDGRQGLLDLILHR